MNHTADSLIVQSLVDHRARTVRLLLSAHPVMLEDVERGARRTGTISVLGITGATAAPLPGLAIRGPLDLDSNWPLSVFPFPSAGPVRGGRN